jgi:hypothetical protein
MFRFYAPIIYGVTDGVLGALEGAATGAAGAALLSAVGCSDYDVTDAAKVGALGRGVLAAYFSARSIKLTNCGFFKGSDSQPYFSFSNLFLSSSHLGMQMLSGLLGQSITKVLNDADMDAGEGMQVMALGAAIMLVPIWLIDTFLYKQVSPCLERCGKKLKLLDRLDEYRDDEDEELDEYQDEDEDEEIASLGSHRV